MATTKEVKLTDTEAEALRRLDAALSIFLKLNEKLPLRIVLAFVRTALNQGVSLKDLAGADGTKMSTMSRHMLELQESNHRLEPGLDIIMSHDNPMDRREKQYWLTPAGRNVANELLKAMGARK